MTTPNILADIPRHVTERYPRDVFMRRCVGGTFEDLSTTAFVDRVRAVSIALQALGLRPGARAAIVAESCPDWGVADLAIMSAGAVTVPIYPTLSLSQTRYVLQDAGACVTFVSDTAQLSKVRALLGLVPSLARVVVMRPAPGDDVADIATPSDAAPVLSLASLVRFGESLRAGDPTIDVRYRETIGSIVPDDLATIIYTSGTTGEPKGVMLTHQNLLSNVYASRDLLDTAPSDIALSFLPLSHTFERMVFYKLLLDGVLVVFAESLQTVARDLLRVRPTMMTGVPRVFEKFYGSVMEQVSRRSALQQRLFDWALGVGRVVGLARLDGVRPAPWLRAQAWLADRLVLRSIRARTGGRLRYIVSGSAPLPRVIAEFFVAIGLPIVEGYGLTESSPVLTANPRASIRLGTVGLPLPGIGLKIADDGEILARGPSVMRGYWNKPAETAEALRDGWLHTGDIGRIDADGYLTITDRKKELLVTTGGKNIAPQPIEARLKNNPLIAEALLVGDGRKFAAVLIVPEWDALEAHLRREGQPAGSREELTKRDDVVAIYQELVDALNEDLAQFERIKRLALVPANLTIEGGELTPTLKVRRKVVEQKWAGIIERLYEARA